MTSDMNDFGPLPSGSVFQICPFRVCSKSTIVDDSEEFPAPEDPLRQLGQLCDVKEPKPTAAERYERKSHYFGVTSFEKVKRLLVWIEEHPQGAVVLDINRCGYSNLQVQLILESLTWCCSERLTTLDLSYNLIMNVTLVQALSSVLQESQTVTFLSLSHCTISEEVAPLLAESLSRSSVTDLRLDHCAISDAVGVALLRGLVYSDCIRSVDLSWNLLEHQSGATLGTFLEEQRSLLELNLEGNILKLFKQCIAPLLQGLAKNPILKRLNLAWNGLQGAELGQLLLKTVPKTMLEALNLEHNRLKADELGYVAKLLRKTETLKEIYLGGNFFTEDDCLELVRAFARNPVLRVLSLGKFQYVSKKVARVARLAMRKNPDKRVEYGGVLLSNPPAKVDVQRMLLDRCRFLAMKPKKAKLKRDFGHLMLQVQQLESAVMGEEEFTGLVKKFKVKLDRDLRLELMAAFPALKNTMDVGAMASKYLSDYPTDPPPPKPAAGKKKKKQQRAK